MIFSERARRVIGYLLGAGALSIPSAGGAQQATAPVTALVADPCPALAAETTNKPVPEADAIRRRDDPADLCRYAADDAARVARSAPVALVMIGDSLTQGWQAAQPDLFDASVAGRGISGQTTPQMLLRFEQDVVALRPAAVHILAGTNDIAGNGGPTSAARIQANLVAMATLARANGIRVMLASLLPADRFGWRPGYRPAAAIAEFNRWLRGYAGANGFAYIDYHAAMATPEGAMRPGLSDDGVHPNRAGYAVMRCILDDARRR